MSTKSFDEKHSRMQMEWLRRFQGPRSDRAAAEEAGVKERTFNNWIRRERIPAEAVLKIAGAAGLDPVRALIQTGYWEEEWSRPDDEVADSSIEFASTSKLVDEMARRVDPDAGQMIRALMSPFVETDKDD